MKTMNCSICFRFPHSHASSNVAYVYFWTSQKALAGMNSYKSINTAQELVRTRHYTYWTAPPISYVKHPGKQNSSKGPTNMTNSSWSTDKSLLPISFIYFFLWLTPTGTVSHAETVLTYQFISLMDMLWMPTWLFIWWQMLLGTFRLTTNHMVPICRTPAAGSDRATNKQCPPFAPCDISRTGKIRRKLAAGP